MQYTRVLKRGMTGEDVRYIKDLLFELGYYNASKIKKITNNNFGSDTVIAVKAYQSKNSDLEGKHLVVDGIIGAKTWESVVRTSNPEKPGEVTTFIPSRYPNISQEALSKIDKDCSRVSYARRKIVEEVLQYAYDHDNGGEITAIYLWGGNLYNKDLSLNIATASKVASGAQSSPSYFNNGRKEMMLKAISDNPHLAASDCSGMIVGCLRKFKYVKTNFDATANSLCSDSYSQPTTTLLPGDWVGYTGHIGVYVGGGYVVEFAGGAYGCQLTNLSSRRLYSFVTGKRVTGTKWTKFRDPKYY